MPPEDEDDEHQTEDHDSVADAGDAPESDGKDGEEHEDPENMGNPATSSSGGYKSPRGMLEDGLKQKEIGLGAYKVGNYERAVDYWNMARGTMKHILDKKCFEGDPAKVEEVRGLETTLWLNLAQAHLKNNEFHQALGFCEKALAREPENSKALYRKASAHLMGNNFRQAKHAIEQLLKVEPENAGAKQLVLEVERKEKASNLNSKKAARKMFAGMDHDPRIREDSTQEDEGWFPWSFCSFCRRRKAD